MGNQNKETTVEDAGTLTKRGQGEGFIKDCPLSSSMTTKSE
ncbi:MAG: hypothetical protein RMY36_015405 [Nostoc sp. SerVER01]|nr:hypothetical protein [Nostoc sp. SerVER01]MDZ8026235.1 hypothetical protein [Nostoc sp. DedQUE11]MDZ8083722.1 hypothetical protein [Nostoc sp. DcaGUA01]